MPVTAPKHPSLVILNRLEAGALLSSQAAVISAVIAVGGKREPPCEGFESVEPRLFVEFDDVPAMDESDPMLAFRHRQRERQAAKVGLTLTQPSVEHARQVIEFAHAVRDAEGTIICHCEAGISRSPAAALLCLGAWTRPGDEAYAVEMIKRLRPGAQPHRDLVRFGDLVLHRQGALVECCKDSFG